MAITLADFNKIWASTSPLTPYSFSESNYKQGWNFIGSTPPARQMWDFLQKNNDEKMQYLANNYLPLSGGTMSGQIKLSGGGTDKRVCNVDTSSMTSFCGGTTYNTGAIIWLMGKDHSTASGVFQIDAHDGTTLKRLEGKPDGTLTWAGISLTDGTFLTTRSVSVETTSTNAYIGTATAPAVSGYQFVCWTYCVSGGAVFPTYPSSPANQTTGIYGTNVVSDKEVICYALYVRKW